MQIKKGENVCSIAYYRVMDYEEFKRHLGRAGLSLREFAALMRLNSNSISNYATTDSIPSHHAIAVVLMGELADNRLDFRTVLKRMNLQPKRVRGAAAVGRFGGSRQTELPMD